jgi:hypothetical protein
MKKALFLPVLFFAFVIVFSLSGFNPSTFPEEQLKQLLSTSNFLNHQYPQEKIYLQFDRPSYWAKDDIWFKAYLKDSPIPDCNLYVELLNSKGVVYQKKMFWAQNGLAYGDFQVEDTISSGIYQIRAYTNWMRNFGEQWFFRKDLVILNIQNKLIASSDQSLSRKNVDFQFFPEGGTFLTNVPGKIAFKATDQNGKGLSVEGRIIDDKGTELAKIKSQVRGMGSFVIEPKKGRSYRAEVVVSGDIRMTVQLPEPQPEGICLAINSTDSEFVNIKVARNLGSSADTVSAEYMLVGQSKGVVFYRKQITMPEDEYSYDIEKFKLPTGIVQFTLFDQNIIPRCERLVFINHHDFVKLEIKPDKLNYLTREKVNLDLNAMTAEGFPCMTNLSMSVYNPEGLMIPEKYSNNILTNFLLGSELKGTIEEPAWYFKDDSLTTQLALDNLMLTHGYRYFEWKAVEENKAPKIDYLPEGSITINGTVEHAIGNKVVPGSKVTLLFQNFLSGVHEQTADSLGHFSFSNIFFRDTAFVSIQALNPNGKRSTWIELDQRSSIKPDVTILPGKHSQEINNNLSNKKWRLSDTILLSEVNVKGFRKPKWDGHVRMYVDADYVFDVKKQDDVYGNIYEMIDGRIPGLRLELTEGGNQVFYYRGTPASLYLDGFPVDYMLLSTFPASSFDKIELLKWNPFGGVSRGGGAIHFYTKRGEKFINQSTDAVGMKSAKIYGYSVIRQFYAPKYESKVQPERKTDFRGTLYWNPILRTDSTGVANVSFYNSDQTGDVDIVVEGVTSDGKLCRGVGKYTVNAK